MKSKLALLLATLLFFNIILPIQAHAAVIPDISQVTATWDPNIETGWDHVYLEYKSLDPQSRYEADKVIAANAYRFLISIGSKPLEGLNQQKFDDFLRSVSPFNIAYNNVLAEQVVHAAWTISGEQYKVFCANVIHNLASNPDYFNTHVIMNDPFVNGAGQQSLQVQYNDLDIDQSLNIYNNIFLGTVLSSTSASISYWFNPLAIGYTGLPLSLSRINEFISYKGSYVGMSIFTYPFASYSESSNAFILRDTYNSYYPQYTSKNAFLTLNCNINSNLSSWIGFSYDNYGSNSVANVYTLPLGGTDVSFNSTRLGRLLTYDHYIEFTYNGSNAQIIQYALQYFNTYLKDYLIYSPGFKVAVTNNLNSNNREYFIDVPFPSGYTWVSPQFDPVNIYNNQYYGSDDDTYFNVDQMVDNIINNDYSTVNNGSNNTFYNDNYYITQPVSGGGVELVTSSSIVYNYITIINNGGGSSSGGSIGSYPYPFDVRIINPDDLKNETETNVTNEILNDNDVNFGDLNFSPSITVGLNAAKDSIEGIVPVTGSSIVAQFVSGIPPDWLALGFVFLILFIAAGFGMSIIRH